ACLPVSCGDDATEVSEPLTQRVCSRPTSWGHWENGSMHIIAPDRQVCLCMSEAEYLSGERLDELNAMLLEDCELDAEPYEFDWTECQQYHDAGYWLDMVTWATEWVMFPPGASVVCD
ncbi:MAG: hypothetical protein KC457_34235, partial [Myxococcales bacterium]|nr:hypothetical protein [Myxococcales bacterium]